MASPFHTCPQQHSRSPLTLTCQTSFSYQSQLTKHMAAFMQSSQSLPQRQATTSCRCWCQVATQLVTSAIQISVTVVTAPALMAPWCLGLLSSSLWLSPGCQLPS